MLSFTVVAPGLDLLIITVMPVIVALVGIANP